MNNHLKLRSISIIALVSSSFVSGPVQSASATSGAIPFTLSVLSPTCTVSNVSSSLTLPATTGPNQTQNDWLSANGINTPGAFGSGLWMTSPSLNQTATISCNASVASILAVAVQPGASASVNNPNTAQQFLIDGTTPVPEKAAGGKLVMAFEQVSINDKLAPYSYMNGAGVVQSYTTPFNTVNVATSSSTATVVWRPVFVSGFSATAFGNPTGGAFTGSAQIVVNY